MTTIKEKVATNSNELQYLATEGGHVALTQWAKANGMDSRSGFSHFKKALAGIGIDYDGLRADGRQQKSAAIGAAVTHELVLYSDAKASQGRFAICGADGQPVWFGRFFDDDRDFNGEQSSGEMAAAKKAVWLASKVAAAVGGVVKLRLQVDAEWLCWANGDAFNPKAGGKARALGDMAQKLGVVLAVEHIPGKSNPADAFTVCSGFKKWQDNDLAALVKEV